MVAESGAANGRPAFSFCAARGWPALSRATSLRSWGALERLGETAVQIVFEALPVEAKGKARAECQQAVGIG